MQSQHWRLLQIGRVLFCTMECCVCVSRQCQLNEQALRMLTREKEKHLDRNCVKNKSLPYASMSLSLVYSHQSIVITVYNVEDRELLFLSSQFFVLLLRRHFSSCFASHTKNRIVSARQIHQIDGKIASIAMKTICVLLTDNGGLIALEIKMRTAI